MIDVGANTGAAAHDYSSCCVADYCQGEWPSDDELLLAQDAIPWLERGPPLQAHTSWPWENLVDNLNLQSWHHPHSPLS